MDVAPKERDVTGGGSSRNGRLLEREHEVAALDSLISGIDRPGARLALIEGAAGIGKTSLLAAARGTAEGEGIRVLAARGSQLEREFPFGVVRQLFEPRLADPKVRAEALSGAAASATAVFEALDGAGPGGPDASFASLHGLYWLTVNLAGERPLLLAIDDLHWVDHPSLRFVAYLVRRLEGLPIAIVAALRPNEPGADAALVAEIAGDPVATSISPGGLTDQGVRALIAQRLGQAPDPAFADACQEATGGNPLLLHELTKAIGVEGTAPSAANTGVVSDLGPRAASRTVLLRLARLSPDAGAVARAAAVLDEGFDVGALAALAGLSEEATARATGELTQAEILRPDQPLGFFHPLIRAAIYHEVPPGERELDHSRAARLLVDAGAPGERIASHLMAVPPRAEAWVAETLREAARGAMRKGAADSAVAYFRRALAEPPPEPARSRLLLELGLSESLTNAPAAVEHLRRAYDSLSDPPAIGLTANVLARALLWEAPAEAAALARRAAGELPAELSDLRLGLQAFEAATLAFGVREPEALARLERFRDPDRICGLGAKMMAAVAAWQWAHANGPAETCVELALRSLEGGEMIAADHGLLPVYAIAALILADREEVMDAWEQMLDQAHRSGSMFGITTIHLWRGYTLYRRGDLLEAEASLRDALISFPRYGYGEGGMAYTQIHLAAILLERGDVAAARAALDSGPEPGEADAARYWLQAQMAILLAEGHAERTLELADEMPRRLPWIVNPTDAYWRSYKALALDRLDRTEEAIALVVEELELARDWGAPATVGRVLRVLGTLERERGLDHLREAVELLERSTTRLEYAKALCALGTALRLARRPTDAREPLYRALELANVCGATALEERARAELGATGARPRREALSGVGSLTPSERRVADLAADGLSNREIAQELYVTPKTVEVHLSSTYRKLEIRSRRELSGALGESPDSRGQS
ncbi:MAG: AAA family ATPase [Solirubrobacterales bacterium]|nr:AAA family ATPase [Solirubrobacterales bacterium]